MAETGKLKRLMIPTSYYNKGLYDIVYYESDSIKELIAKRMLIVNSFKPSEFRTLEETQKLI